MQGYQKQVNYKFIVENRDTFFHGDGVEGPYITLLD